MYNVLYSLSDIDHPLLLVMGRARVGCGRWKMWLNGQNAILPVIAQRL